MTKSKSYFTIRHEAEESHDIVEFSPCFVAPLGLDELTSNEQSPLDFKFKVDKFIVNGVAQNGQKWIKAPIVFHEPLRIFALVQGGWLPPPFAMPRCFLVDRNVVIKLREIREMNHSKLGQSVQYWLSFFEQNSAVFNPLPYAFEAGLRRKPTIEEFIKAYDDGVNELHTSLPGCTVMKCNDDQYKAGYAQLEAFDERYARESQFLQKTVPLIVDRVSRNQEQRVLSKIITDADSLGINRRSLISLLVLSCLYENIDGVPPSIGRKIIKPKPNYGEGDCYNAITDLRHIEVAMAVDSLFPEKAFSLCTCDEGITSLWCALAQNGEITKEKMIEITFDTPFHLFQRLTSSNMDDLRVMLSQGGL
jgi:hypothetical protein